jgi:hypothetical protein
MRHRHQDVVLIIADMMWALRRLGAHVFFPEYKLPQAQRFILVGEEPGYADYFEEVARRIAIAKKKLSKLNISGSASI